MIDESLLKSNFAGKDGFVWWVGQVANPSVWRNDKSKVDLDGSWAYRCKVRIVGYHTFDGTILPDEDLPWAHILTAAADGSPGQGGFGKTPNLVGGESVLGFFMDGEEAQQPVVVSCFYRNVSVKNNITPDLVAKEKSSRFQPFTGMQGSLKATPTRIKPQKPGTINKPPEVTNSGTNQPAMTVKEESKPLFNVDNSINLSPDASYVTNSDFNLGITSFDTPSYSSITSGYTNPLSGLPDSSISGSQFGKTELGYDRLFADTQAVNAFLASFHTSEVGPYSGDDGCKNNFLADMQATLQSFISFINKLQKTAFGFIDPVRNVVVNVKTNIKRVARLLISIFKFITNGIRDNITKLISCLFKAFAITIPEPQWLQLSEATKQILNVVFCIFEKLFGPLFDFMMALLEGLIGKAPNIPKCAAEETLATLIGKAADFLTDALDVVLSGIDWLTGGISQITSYITGAFGMLNQLLGFLSCDGLACKGKAFWDPFNGVKLPEYDKWAQTLNNFDLLGGAGGSVDEWASLLSMYGGQETIFKDCRQTIINPKTQDDVWGAIPPGTKWYYCIPPEIVITGDGVGAKAKAIVNPKDGSILTIKVLNSGKGYSKEPTITIVDASNFGTGAYAKAKIDDGGYITDIYMIEKGSGYCVTDLNVIGLGSTSVGVGTTSTPTGIGLTNPGISTTPVGIITNIIVDKPGYGYTSGDTISWGNCIYSPILTQNGNIIGVTSASYCKIQFLDIPEITINTNTGQGAELYPVVQYVPQYVTDNQSTVIGIGTNFISVVDCPGPAPGS